MLAGANAKLINAQTELYSSQTNFERVTREKFPNSENLQKTTTLMLPETLSASLELANLNNVDLLISQLDYEIAIKDLNIERARLSPSASINYSKSSYYDLANN